MDFDPTEYERQLKEARLELAVFNFDPKLHPRDLKGRFREVLDSLQAEAKNFGVDINAYTTADTDDDPGGIKVQMVKTQEDARGEGRAGQVMKAVTKLADEAGVPVVLTPGETDRKAMSKKQLTDWYKRLGFKPNKGRNKDYRFMDTMIRQPEKPTPHAAIEKSKPQDKSTTRSGSRWMVRAEDGDTVEIKDQDSDFEFAVVPKSDKWEVRVTDDDSPFKSQMTSLQYVNRYESKGERKIGEASSPEEAWSVLEDFNKKNLTPGKDEPRRVFLGKDVSISGSATTVRVKDKQTGNEYRIEYDYGDDEVNISPDSKVLVFGPDGEVLFEAPLYKQPKASGQAVDAVAEWILKHRA